MYLRKNVLELTFDREFIIFLFEKSVVLLQVTKKKPKRKKFLFFFVKKYKQNASQSFYR